MKHKEMIQQSLEGDTKNNFYLKQKFKNKNFAPYKEKAPENNNKVIVNLVEEYGSRI